MERNVSVVDQRKELTDMMDIRGAVLERSAADRPYRDSRPISISTLQLNGPAPGEILVRIEATGVCHSDLSVVTGDRLRPLPMLLGNESAGRIEQLGEGVPGLKVGQRVVMTFLPRCGRCAGCRSDGKTPCENGTIANNAGSLLGNTRRLSRDGMDVQHHLGVSGFATHAVVSHGSVVPVEDDIPPEIAAMLGCAVLTGGGAVLNAAQPGPESTLAVVGLGGVGMAALITAAAIGVKRLIGIDSVPQKLELARELGADEAYSPQEVLAAGIRPDLVIEAAGHPRAFETAVTITAPGGTTVTVGLPAPDQTAVISPLVLTGEARTIVGSYLGSAVPSRDIPIYAQLWRDGKLAVDKLISSRIRLDEINAGMDALYDGEALRQVVILEDDENTHGGHV